jgi:hypothetical protein
MNAPSIPDGVIKNFEAMKRACANGDLGLIACSDAVTGEPRWVIAAMSVEGSGDVVFVPFGHMSGGNPYEEYVPPSAGADEPTTH